MNLTFWVVAAVVPLISGSPVVPEDNPRALEKEWDITETESEQDVQKKGKIWAVLVAGSNQFYNYRHQADICHAYQIFHEHGVPDENIIVMMYDDIANDPFNPNPGVIINKPGGPNVYKNVPKDYTGDTVTSQNFLNVITGNGAALEGIGSGKVLKSGPNDHVFIDFVGRGSPGEVAFPNDHLYADDLNDAFKTMHKKKMYKKLLVYLESSHSGSMFDQLLPSNIDILAVSASLPTQDSYATYWDDDLDVYLGDLFSISWMEDIDSEEHHKNLTTETLTKQYNNVVQRCNGSSNPTMYGTKSTAKAHITDFFGKDQKKPQTSENGVSTTRLEEVVKNQDVLLYTLKKKIGKSSTPEGKVKLQKELDVLLEGRRQIENIFDRIISHLPEVDLDTVNHKLVPLTSAVFPCYKTLVDAFNRECVNVARNTFTMQHLYKFANICASEEVSTDLVLEAFEAECVSPNSYDNIH